MCRLYPEGILTYFVSFSAQCLLKHFQKLYLDPMHNLFLGTAMMHTASMYYIPHLEGFDCGIQFT